MKTKFTKSTGHGNHWECLGSSAGKIIQKFVPITIAKGEIGVPAERVGQWGKMPTPAKERLTSIIYSPQPLGCMVIIVSDHRTNDNALVTAFPYSALGDKRTLELQEIRDWQNETEAVLVCESEIGQVAFFDTHYFENQDRYAIGAKYDFNLAGLIYQARCTNDETFQTTDQEALEKIYASFDEKTERLPDGTLPPITHELAGCTGLVGVSEDYPEDAEFYCVVKAVTEFDLEGIHIYQITPETGDENVPLPGVIFGAALKFKNNYVPKVGDSLGGGLWVQGCLLVD